MILLETTPRLIMLSLAFLLHACGVATALDGEDEGGAVFDVELELIDRAYDVEGYTGDQPRIPGRGATVELVAASSGAIVDRTTSDAAGRAQLAWPADLQRAYVRAVAELRGERIMLEIVHPETQNELYALRSEDLTEPPGEVLRLGVTDDVDHPANRALHVNDTAWRADRFLEPLVDSAAVVLRIHWGPGHSFACGSCYGGQRIQLGGSPEDPDEFDDDIILHEIGHFISDVWSRDDSPGGRHVGDPIDPRLAWGEGLATALSSMMRESGDYVDFRESYVRYFDIESASEERFYGTENGNLDGALSEYLVAGLLWDLFSGSEVAGRQGMGARPIFEVLTQRLTRPGRPDIGYPGVDLADFLSEMQCVDGVDTTLVGGLIEERLYPLSLDESQCAHKLVPGDVDGEGARAAAVPQVDPRFFRLRRVGAHVLLEHPRAYDYAFDVRVQTRGASPSDVTRTCAQNGCEVYSAFDEDTVLIVTGSWEGWEPFGFGMIGARALAAMQGSYRVVAREGLQVREYLQP